MNIIERLDLLFVNRPARAETRRREALALFEMLPLPTQPWALEIGCGQGVGTRLLVEGYDARVVATDIDDGQLDLARRRLVDLPQEAITYRAMDARKMPFDNTSFEVVCAFGVLHHIDPGWRDALREVGRVLTTGGFFVFIDWLMSDGVARLIQKTIRDWDVIDEPMLRQALESSGLAMEIFETDPSCLGLMQKCKGVAKKQENH